MKWLKVPSLIFRRVGAGETAETVGSAIFLFIMVNLPKLLDRVRDKIHLKDYSIRTE